MIREKLHEITNKKGQEAQHDLKRKERKKGKKKGKKIEKRKKKGMKRKNNTI
jgi:hypothetical protein